MTYQSVTGTQGRETQGERAVLSHPFQKRAPPITAKGRGGGRQIMLMCPASGCTSTNGVLGHYCAHIG